MLRAVAVWSEGRRISSEQTTSTNRTWTDNTCLFLLLGLDCYYFHRLFCCQLHLGYINVSQLASKQRNDNRVSEFFSLTLCVIFIFILLATYSYVQLAHISHLTSHTSHHLAVQQNE